MAKHSFVFVVPSLQSGGAEKVMAFVAGRFADQGHAVRLLTWDDGRVPPFHALNANVEHTALNIAADSQTIFQALYRNLKRIRALRREFKRLRPDLILSFLDTTNVVVLLAAAGLGIPVAVGERMDPEFYPKKNYWRILRAITYPRAAHIFVQTEKAKAFFSSALQRKTTVIPNPVFPAPARCKRSEPAIAAVGRLEYPKGFDVLLNAFADARKSFSQWRLLIVGKGPMRGELEGLSRQLGLEGAVEFRGEIQNPWEALASCSIFVMPSRSEGFPNALGEAMAAEFPSLASNCTGCSAIIDDGVNGLLFASGDVSDLKKKLAMLMGDADLRDRLAREAPNVTRKFDANHLAAEWERMLVSLAAERAR